MSSLLFLAVSGATPARALLQQFVTQDINMANGHPLRFCAALHSGAPW
jgi:hypothetical protein